MFRILLRSLGEIEQEHSNISRRVDTDIIPEQRIDGIVVVIFMILRFMILLVSLGSLL